MRRPTTIHIRATFLFIWQHCNSQHFHNLLRRIFHVAPPQPKFCDLSPQTQSRLLRRPVCKVIHITARKCHARSRKTWGTIGQVKGTNQLLKPQLVVWQKHQFFPTLLELLLCFWECNLEDLIVVFCKVHFHISLDQVRKVIKVFPVVVGEHNCSHTSSLGGNHLQRKQMSRNTKRSSNDQGSILKTSMCNE